jgi:hypothetical protein
MNVFTGCRSPADAEARLRARLERYYADQLRRLHTSLLSPDRDEPVDIDVIDDAIAYAEAMVADNIDEVIAAFFAANAAR